MGRPGDEVAMRGSGAHTAYQCLVGDRARVHAAGTHRGLLVCRVRPVVAGRHHRAIYPCAWARSITRRAAGVTPEFVRVAVGLEHLEDIKADFDQALAKSAA